MFVRTDKWHAEYMQSTMQIDANFFFNGLPRNLQHISTLTQTCKLSPKDYYHTPFSWALGRNYRQELSKQVERQCGHSRAGG